MECAVCFKPKAHVFDIDQLARLLSPIIQQNFAPSRDDLNNYDPDGDSLGTIVALMLQQDLEFLDDLVSAIVETDDSHPHEAECFFDSNVPYCSVQHSVSTKYFDARWGQLVNELKHKRRFFSEAVQHFFGRLFADVETLKTWRTGETCLEGVVCDYSRGMYVYRARAIEPDDAPLMKTMPYLHVGPPPRQKARAMRMSPEGVVVLYCAMKSETAIAELRPAIGGTVAVVTLALSRPVRVLDFERLERSLDGNLGQLLRPDLQTSRETLKFLRKLHKLISDPVGPGHEDDYLITQFMAEYLAHVHLPQIDGVRFKSAQDADGVNVVLFPERDSTGEDPERFPVEYVSDSLAFHRVESVKYFPIKLFPIPRKNGGLDLLSEREMMDLANSWRD